MASSSLDSRIRLEKETVKVLALRKLILAGEQAEDEQANTQTKGRGSCLFTVGPRGLSPPASSCREAAGMLSANSVLIQEDSELVKERSCLPPDRTTHTVSDLKMC